MHMNKKIVVVCIILNISLSHIMAKENPSNHVVEKFNLSSLYATLSLRPTQHLDPSNNTNKLTKTFPVNLNGKSANCLVVGCQDKNGKFQVVFERTLKD